MNYRLLNENYDIENPKKTFFNNRGIDNYLEYKNVNENSVIPYENLDNIDIAVKCFNRHIENNSKIGILVDCDCDGLCSSAIMYKYIYDVVPFANIQYFIHKGKQHGLSYDIEIPDDIQLLIIPDAGSNDSEQCKALKEKGIDIIILDHHICDKKNPYAIVVNNQLSDNYSNKDFCGAGITYKFCKALDEENWTEYADKYLDLVALGNIADCMDIRSYETKYYINEGLKNINNKFFQQAIEAQSYSIGDNFNIHSIAFYISPMINAMCRCGDMDEKDLLFKAFIEQDEVFKYKKRGEQEEIDEDIYTRAVRFCKNVKAKQDKMIQKALPILKEGIEKKKINLNPIMFIKSTDEVPNVLTGTIAMKLAEYYNRPCLILNKHDEQIYGGSGRNFDTCPIENLKDTLTELKEFEFVQGHFGAFGFSIKAENIKNAIEKSKNTLSHLDFESIPIDFIIDFKDLTVSFIREIDNLKDFYGTGLKEPYIYIENIEVSRNQCNLMGKEKNTWKIVTDENIAIVKFKNDENDKILKWINDDEANNEKLIVINVLGNVNINNYNGILTPQILVKEYEVI